MKTIITTILTVALSMSAANALAAGGHAYISSIPHDHVKEGVFRVNIEKIEGKEPSPGPNHYAHVGEMPVTVSLVFNASWGKGMADTSKYIYMKDIVVNTEKGKHYYLGAKVDTNASPEAQADGSFWEPVIDEIH